MSSRLRSRTTADHHRVEKRWGFEEWIINNEMYCGKMLVFNAGQSTSMHYHSLKHETMFCIKGSFLIECIDPTDASRYDVELALGESLVIPPDHPHRIVGLEDFSTLIEFSTMHRDEDSYRVG